MQASQSHGSRLTAHLRLEHEGRRPDTPTCRHIAIVAAVVVDVAGATARRGAGSTGRAVGVAGIVASRYDESKGTVDSDPVVGHAFKVTVDDFRAWKN